METEYGMDAREISEVKEGKLEPKICKGKNNDSASDEIANTTFLKNRNLYR